MLAIIVATAGLEDAKISLPGGARLVFLHYHTCRTATVVGGRIRFGAEAYAIIGGTKESDARTPCPRTGNSGDTILNSIR